MFPVVQLLFSILIFAFLHDAESAVLERHVWLPTSINASSKDTTLKRGDGKTRPGRDKHSSKLSLLSGTYDEYKFNYLFESYFTEDAPDYVYQLVKEYFAPIISTILKENQLPLLDSPAGKIWRELKDLFVESFENERGVIIYDQDYLRWVYCGWLKFNSVGIRMCAPLLPLGMVDVKRPAEKNKDYIPKDPGNSLFSLAEGEQDKEDGIISIRRKTDGDEYYYLIDCDGHEYYYLMDLFDYDDDEESYDEDCLEENGGNIECQPICCYSSYIGSEFCSQDATDCIYFRD